MKELLFSIAGTLLKSHHRRWCKRFVQAVGAAGIVDKAVGPRERESSVRLKSQLSAPLGPPGLRDTSNDKGPCQEGVSNLATLTQNHSFRYTSICPPCCAMEKYEYSIA